MWTYTGLAVVFFSVLAITIEFASKSQAMAPVDLTDALHHKTLSALAAQSVGRPVVHPLTPKDLRAFRLQNGHLLVCGRTLSEYPDLMTGFSVQFVQQDGRVVPHRTYIDRKADRLCEGGRIPLMSFSPLTR
ncbi:MAG: hypothetical protein NXH97_17600 [Rhodobacteraceae bacterium]|nr:hypothetical protein [Paracoccaceae bacterium]